MPTEAERIANSENWLLGGDVDATPTDLDPNYGPVWVTWSNPNYVSFTEKFETASHAADEMWRRTTDRYYPLWYDVEALVYGVDPDETGDAYPLAEMHLRDGESAGEYTITLNDV